MNTRMQTDTWIFCTAVVLGLILVTSVAGIVFLKFMGQPTPGLLVALATVAGAGLPQLLLSPLNRGLFD